MVPGAFIGGLRIGGLRESARRRTGVASRRTEDPVAVDLTGSGRLDLVFGGRHGLYWLENLGKGDSIGQGETNDPLKFPAYSDHSNLMVVKDLTGKEKPVKDAFDAGQRRAQTLAAAQAVMGVLPDS